MMQSREIYLSTGEKVLLDEEDYLTFSKLRWHKCGNYAARWERVYPNGGSKQKIVLMHRLINATPEGFDTDHINRDTLDNRRINLRTVSRSLNQHNTKTRTNNTSGKTGVTKFKNGWQARIMLRGKSYFLGYHRVLDDAVAARKQAEGELL